MILNILAKIRILEYHFHNLFEKNCFVEYKYEIIVMEYFYINLRIFNSIADHKFILSK